MLRATKQEIGIFQRAAQAFQVMLGRSPDSNGIIALREEVERKALQIQKRVLEDGAFGGPNWIGNVVDPYEPLFDNADFWSPMWGTERLPPTLNKTLRGDLIPVYITWYGLKVIRDFSRKLCVMNEFAIGAMTNRSNYICGKGFQHRVTPKNGKESPETMYLCDIAQKWIDEFSAAQNWSEVEQEAVTRCDRDGECFIRFFHVGGGHTEARFVEPEWVQGPEAGETETYGVINSPGDVADVTGYYVIENPPAGFATFVPAEEILHIKLNSDSTSKRGLPTFYPIRKNLERAEKLLRNMSILAQVQATFAMIRKHKQYSAAQVAAFQQNQADTQWVGAFTGQTKYAKQYGPGSIIDAPESMDYEFPSAGVNAGGLVAILQAELQAAGQRVNMPAYMFSGDTGNVNLATAFIAESPFVKGMEKMQSFFARRFGDGSLVKVKNSGAMWRVLANAVDYGGMPKQVLTSCEIIVEGPTLVVRDKGQETQRAGILNQVGVLSKSTWSKWEGLDREQEEKQCKEEVAEMLKQQLEQQQAQMAAQQQMQAQQAAQQQAAGAQQGQDPSVVAQQQQALQQQQAQQAAQQAQGQPQQGQPGQQAPGVAQGLRQTDLGAPTSDSGFVSQQGGNQRDLLGL